MNIPAKKSLGQNFLKDEIVLQKIANSIEVSKNDLIIEIGPGKGALTKYLIQKEAQYMAYEIDERMKSILNKLPISIIYDDFLKRDLGVDLLNFSYDNLYVIANIPYYITTPIIEHIIDSNLNVSKMVLLVQKEVAERFCAQPCTKDYGYFTVYLNYYFNVFKLFDVSKECFDPMPKVTSSVVLFTRKHTSNKAFLQDYFKFLKECFSNKRKTLKNNLQKYDFNKIEEILARYGYSNSVRAEELESSVFLEIYNNLC